MIIIRFLIKVILLPMIPILKCIELLLTGAVKLSAVIAGPVFWFVIGIAVWALFAKSWDNLLIAGIVIGAEYLCFYFAAGIIALVMIARMSVTDYIF